MKRIMLVCALLSAFTGHSMHFVTRASSVKIIKKKISNSRTPIVISSAKGTSKTTLETLSAKAKRKNKAIVLTLTPRPFKTAGKGCTAHLTAFDKAMATLHAPVYALKIHNTTCKNSKIISSDKPLAKALKLETFDVGKNKYLAHLSIVIKPSGKFIVISLDSPVTEASTQEHFETVKKYVEDL